MDGAKLVTDTKGLIFYEFQTVGRRSVRAEAGLRSPVDLADLRILAGVATKMGENPIRRKDEGSSAMFVNRGLGGPKCCFNMATRKGSRLIFLPQISTRGNAKFILRHFGVD